MRDSTARLRQSQPDEPYDAALVRALLAASSDAAFVIDEDGVVLDVHVSSPEFLLSSPAEIRGRHARELVPPNLADRVMETIRRTLVADESQTLEYSLELPVGTRTFLARTSTLFDRGERLVLWLARDVTEKRRNAAALRTHEELHRRLVDESPDGIFVEEAGIVTHANRAFLTAMGVTSAESILGRSWLDFVHPSYRDGERERMARVRAGSPAETVGEIFVRPDGGEIAAEVRAILTPASGEVHVIVRDVAERVREQEEARRHQRNAALILDSVNAQIWHFDAEARVLFTNAFAERETGVSSESARGKTVLELAPGSEASATRHRDLLEVLRTGRPRLGAVETTLVGAEKRWHSVDKIPLRDADRVTGLVVFVYDITALKRAEEEAMSLSAQLEMRVKQRTAQLVETQDLFQTFMKHAPITACIKDTRGRYVFVNEPGEKMLGIPAWRGKTDREILPPDMAERAEQSDADVRRTRAALTYTATTTLTTGTRTLTVIKFPIPRGQDEPYVGVAVIDVSERAKLEEQLVQAQKMEGIGRLAGGVAHDFNNLLTVVQAHGQFVKDELGPDHPLMADVDPVLEAASRAATLTRQLLMFARQAPSEIRTVDLAELTMGIDRMLRRVLGEDVELSTLPGTGVGPVDLDPRQMEQVLINLAVNARDAMPNGGRITVSTHALDVSEAMARARPGLPVGFCVEIRVADTGVGMDAATLAHIFEPFFSTKAVGKGTGLGLATSYGILKRFGGHIWAESAPGGGTTFHVVLPCSPHATTKRAASPSVGPSGYETILLVEDNALVRDAMARGLTRYGYRVIPTRSGAEALAIAGEGRFDLVLTDVVMPAMSGPELAERIRKIHPGMKVLFMSGYLDDTPSQRRLREMSDCQLIAKPFTPALLAKRLRAILDATS